jgi:hypothetical protein
MTAQLRNGRLVTKPEVREHERFERINLHIGDYRKYYLSWQAISSVSVIRDFFSE